MIPASESTAIWALYPGLLLPCLSGITRASGSLSEAIGLGGWLPWASAVAARCLIEASAASSLARFFSNAVRRWGLWGPLCGDCSLQSTVSRSSLAAHSFSSSAAASSSLADSASIHAWLRTE